MLLIFDKLTDRQLAASRFSSLSGRFVGSIRQSFLPPASGRGFFLPSELTLGSATTGYTRSMLWIKAFHIVFIASWFAGLFYLPRIYVNLAMVPADSVAERNRLLLMARKLYRFMTILAVPALALGLWLWLYYGIGLGSVYGWMHAKLLIVLALMAYHYNCGVLLSRFEKDQVRYSHLWFRWFNEAPVLMMIAAVVLVVVKPF